jgi:predicted DNA-binding WGR domain protein
LDKGKWELHYFKDADDANVNAAHLVIGKMKVELTDQLKISMAPGGGYAAYIIRK